MGELRHVTENWDATNGCHICGHGPLRAFCSRCGPHCAGCRAADACHVVRLTFPAARSKSRVMAVIRAAIVTLLALAAWVAVLMLAAPRGAMLGEP